jgi:hypothetical protein
MSFLIAQNLAQTFLSKLVHNFYHGIKKTAQSKQSPNGRNFAHSGTDVMIIKKFSLKTLAFFPKLQLNFANI